MYGVRKFVLNVMWLCVIVKNCQSKTYENISFIRVPRQSNSNGCILPPHPKFGQWTIFQSTFELLPGNIVPSGTILQISCNSDNYKLDSDQAIVCINRNWTARISQCLRTCPSLRTTAARKVTCTYKATKLENCTDPVDGTIARFQCADFYENRGLEKNLVNVCFNGAWSHSLPECVPVCGRKSLTDDPTLIVGGLNVTKGDYPWQAAIYNITNKNLICGGTLLNQKVVLTAAHCITDASNGELHSKNFFMVAVGKYFRKYDDPRDSHEAQFSSIEEMYVPQQYKGDIQNYFGDIAILVTKEAFVLSVRIQPVCVDWGSIYQHTLLDPIRTQYGYVSGWGYTVGNKQPSEVLKQLKVPLITYEQCIRNIPEDFSQFVTDDKLCAGYLDSGTSVCKGDSGGGLVAKFQNRYYVIAVVSLSPQAPTTEGGCDTQQYTLYTRVSYYVENFILEKESRFNPWAFGNVDCNDDLNCRTLSPTRPSTSLATTNEFQKDSCKVPAYPANGRLSVFGTNSKISPGMSVPPRAILQISCSKQHKLSGNEIVICENGKWASQLGQCLRTCPPLYSTQGTEITCSLNNAKTEDCSYSLDGTIAKYKCTAFYENLHLLENSISVCKNGLWDRAVPECVPICGKKYVAAQTLIVNGTAVNKSEYPWQVGIYRKQRKRFICNGALISTRVILTAAHCVTRRSGELLSKDDYRVAVGKHHYEYFNPLDTEAQFSELQDIFILPEFGGLENNYFGDIAVLVTKKSFSISPRVQPVCVDWASKYRENLSGYVSGWGYTRRDPNASLATTLQHLQVPIIPNEKCLEELPDFMRVFVKPDTLCAGYLNMGTSLCNGDGGAPLITNHENRLYITGIVSVSPSTSEGVCDTQNYALYTNVSHYHSFISEKQKQIKSSVKTKQPEGPRTSCSLPDHPAHGEWSLYGLSSTLPSPGMLVNPDTVLQIRCDNTYKLDGNSPVYCKNGNWSSSIGQCFKTCASVYSTHTMKVTCITKGQESENCTEPIDGTRVKYKCVPFSEDLQLSQNTVYLCQDGHWNHKTPQCVPVCGQKSVSAQTLIVNGVKVKKGDYPWHVAIYHGSQKEFVCSGSLISQRIILTAAQCVTRKNGTVLPKEQYEIAAGKYYRSYEDLREQLTGVQFSMLDDLFVPSEYTGLSRMFVASIAILVTTKTLTLSQKVRPVCVDWGLNYANDIIQSTGYVTGWGYTTQNRQLADELRDLQVPVISTEKCRKEIPENLLTLLTYDKMCAGHLNQSKSVCRGDSGGGLVMKFDGRYYITGILATAPGLPSGECDIQQYAFYTNVSKYIDSFILPKSARYK